MNKLLLRAGAGAAALAVAGVIAHRQSARAERSHPAPGRFVTAHGVRLHYLDEGSGPPLVLLHGIGSMVDDFVLSGLVREAAKHYRVLAFDRPGYGHSERPQRWRFGPVEQAHVLHEALRVLDVKSPIVLGHSWGALVAVALALEHPGALRSLVLEAGLYFPSLRVDAPLMIWPAVPLFGALMRHTLSPLAGRAMWPAFEKTIFAPAPVSPGFHAFPTWMALRPSQLCAVAEEAMFTLPATVRLSRRYRELELPVVLVAGSRDRYVSARAHTLRLHRMLPASRALFSQRAGHMVHHSDLPLVMDAIGMAASRGEGPL
jgi:pimeloyl-ACP methyl ester carboxylesterase